jgi:3-oxoacyl-[acyl-carrier protein] reductase
MGESLRGTCVVVTGAGRGIGRAIAIGLGREGASVCCAARTLAEIEATALAVTQAGGRGMAVSADVTRLQDVRAMLARAEGELGGIDVLFVNAGGSFETASVESGDPGKWRETIELNLIGAYHCMREVVPHLRRRGGGKIITLGSGLGHRGSKGTSAYSAAKAGLWMLTRVLAQEVAEAGISVNELVPGPVLTDRNRAAAAGRAGVFGIEGEWTKEPRDVVPIAVFLATQPRIGPTAQSFSLMRRDG